MGQHRNNVGSGRIEISPLPGGGDEVNTFNPQKPRELTLSRVRRADSDCLGVQCRWPLQLHHPMPRSELARMHRYGSLQPSKILIAMSHTHEITKLNLVRGSGGLKLHSLTKGDLEQLNHNQCVNHEVNTTLTRGLYDPDRNTIPPLWKHT